MVPVLGYIVAGLVAASSIGHNSLTATQTRVGQVIYECPETYKLATRRSGEIICLRYRKDLNR
jgi:hypothetical protein